MLQLPVRTRELSAWRELVRRIQNPQGEVTIGVVGKYVSLTDAYKSLNEALSHGGVSHNVRVRLEWIEAEDLEQGSVSCLEGVDGVLVPGGFGPRGAEGMAAAAGWARRHRVPYFGICYGFQWAVVEYARSVCGLSEASSVECHPDSPDKVILKLRDLVGVEEMGGTMRLGAYDCVLQEGSLAEQSLRDVAGLGASSPSLRVQPGVRAAFSPTTGCVFRDVRRTESSSRSRRFPSIPGFWRCSFIPSSSRAPSLLIRCSASSSAPPGGTSGARAPTTRWDAEARYRKSRRSRAIADIIGLHHLRRVPSAPEVESRAQHE